MIYLACLSKKAYEYPEVYGIMCNVKRIIGGQWDALNDGIPWALDNGCFSGFDEYEFTRVLKKYRDYTDTCLFAVVPDVPFDWPTTLKMFRQWRPEIERHGFPVAIASQNGATVHDIPWQVIDALFIGGDHFHKRYEGPVLAWHAKKRGKWVHVARVQSGMRILKHYQFADSVDGTTHKNHPTQQDASIVPAVQQEKNYQWQMI